MRRLILALTVMAVTLVVSSGVALAVVRFGGPGDNLLNGTNGPDNLFGGDGRDDVEALNGTDRGFGGYGADVIKGGFGPDWIHGGAHSDALGGEEGADTLLGERGADVLVAERGVDRVLGGPGNDIFVDGQLAILFPPVTAEDRALGLFWLPPQLRDLGERYYGDSGTGQAVAYPGDASTDTFIGSDGDDRFFVDSAPAHRDVVSCGAGTDTVRADSADYVAPDCENVGRV